MPKSLTIDQCQVQIVILLDENVLREGTTNGIYMVDNRFGGGSAYEGSAALSTSVSRGEGIYWRVQFVNPNSGAFAEIDEIGNSPAWGFEGQPTQAQDNRTAFSGEAQVAGNYYYSLSIEYEDAQGEGMTLKLQPIVSVV